jgi:16S rRNA (uracil1498-N3)-methyltransferase
MNLERFYCENIGDNAAELTGAEAHYLKTVLRLQKGNYVEIFDGRGAAAKAVVTDISRQGVSLRIEQLHKFPAPASERIIIACSMVKAGRFDLVIKKCTELGVDRIIPVLFERTVKLARGSRLEQRWQKLVIEAARQCRRSFLTKIDKPLTLAAAIETVKKDYSSGQIVYGSLEKTGSILKTHLNLEDTIVFVGPEGGITENETSLLEQSGAKAIRLTETVLRVETAAIAFASVLAAIRTDKKT